MSSESKKPASATSHARNEIFSVQRFLFSISIVLFHFAPASIKIQFQGLTSGSCLVTFFFVLSGFFAQRSIDGKIVDRLAFLKKKFWRLAPYFYLSMALCIAFDLLNGRFRWLTFLNNLLMTQSVFPDTGFSFNGPSWFVSALSVNFCLLMILLPVIGSLGRKKLVGLTVVIWIGNMVIQLWLAKIGLSGISYLTPWTHFPAFLAGFTGAACLGSSGWRSISNPALLVAVTVLIFAELHFRTIESISSLIFAPNGYYTPMFTALVLVTANQSVATRKLFDTGAIRFLGNASYPIYILQAPLYILGAAVMRKLLLDVGEILECLAIGCFIVAASTMLMFAIDHLLKQQQRFVQAGKAS